MFRKICIRNCFINLFAGAFLAFGIYNVHAVSGVSEGGIFGLTLLLHHGIRLSPAISNPILNALCYLLGWKTLGRRFLLYSAFSNLGFSVAYSVYEAFPPLWPKLASHPLLAALLGAVFVGVGVGLCVRAGGAPCGDDALAMSLQKLFHIPIQRLYLLSDMTVLLLSLSYIPYTRIVYSVVTVVLSGQIIGWIQQIPVFKKHRLHFSAPE